MSEKCGLCGSKDISSGSWSPDRCENCGAIESVGEWYIDKTARPTLDEIKAIKKGNHNGSPI